MASGISTYGGKINLLVHPAKGFSSLVTVTDDLKPSHCGLIEHTFLLFLLALLTSLTVSSPIYNSSESILCLVKSSTSTAQKSLGSWRVIGEKSIPLISNFSLVVC